MGRPQGFSFFFFFFFSCHSASEGKLHQLPPNFNSNWQLRNRKYTNLIIISRKALFERGCLGSCEVLRAQLIPNTFALSVCLSIHPATDPAFALDSFPSVGVLPPKLASRDQLSIFENDATRSCSPHDPERIVVGWG